MAVSVSQSHIVREVCLRSVICAALVTAGQASTPQASLTVEPAEIAVGQAVTVRWNVPAGSQAFLTSQGVITGPNSGDVQVKPVATSDFLLVVECGDTASVLSRHVRVSGTKGSALVWPDLSHPLTVKNEYDFKRIGYPAFCERTRVVLQQDFAYVWIDERDGSVSIATAFSDHFIPVDPKERPRKFRRIAYRVHLSKFGQSVRAEISTHIDWRIPIDDDAWYPDDLAICKRMLSELKQRLSE